MSTLPRKTGSNTIGQRTASSALVKQAGALPSPQYFDALNVLSEATMAEACALALSETDYENPSGERADLKKLLEIEKKCREAAKVIHKEALAAPALTLPPSMPTIPAARANPGTTKKAAAAVSKSMGTAPKGMVGKTIAPSTSGKTGIVSMRRGSLAGARPGGLQGKRAMTQQLPRSESDEALGSGNAANKKARLGSAVAMTNSGPSHVQKKSMQGAGEGTSDAPPPSALNFLKKLNQDKATTGDSSSKQTGGKTEIKPRKKETEKEKEHKDDDYESDASEEGDRKRTSPGSKTPREGVRKNPTRGARR